MARQLICIVYIIQSLYLLLLQLSSHVLQNMYSKSSSVKSKKQKMNEKRHQKGRSSNQIYTLHRKSQPAQVIVDSSSRSSSSVELVEVRRSKDMQRQRMYKKEETKRYENETKHNNFNYDRLKKMPVSMKVDFKPVTLNVEECLDGIEEADSNRIISYKKIGVTAKRTICQNYLKTRLENIPEETEVGEKAHLEVNQDEKGEIINQNNQNQIKIAIPSVPAEEAQTKKRHRVPRYFDQELSQDSQQKDQEAEDDQQEAKKVVKCFRCGEKGHIARLCNQRQILKCQYCLGPHHTTECTDRLCHRCNQKGHIKQDCKSEKIQCRKCRMVGHIAKNCGKIIMMNFSADRQRQIRERYEVQDLEKLKCLKCNGQKNSKGHFNCQQYSKKTPRIYDEPYIIL